MAETEEAGFEFGAKKARSARQGRRAQQQAPVPNSDPAEDLAGEDNLDVTESSKPSAEDFDAPPKPSKRMGGWGEETTRRKMSSSKGKFGHIRRRGMDDIEDDERLRPQTAEKDNDSDNDIPVIPDLDDAQEDDLSTQIAMAPNVAVNRVATYRELDNDLLKHAAFLTLDDVDLKLLAKSLSAESEVREEDKPWEWDRLFTEVTSELLTEWEKMENPEAEEAT